MTVARAFALTQLDEALAHAVLLLLLVDKVARGVTHPPRLAGAVESSGRLELRKEVWTDGHSVQWLQVAGSVHWMHRRAAAVTQKKFRNFYGKNPRLFIIPTFINNSDLGFAVKKRRGLVLQFLPARSRRRSESWLDGGPALSIKKDRRDREPAYQQPSGGQTLQGNMHMRGRIGSVFHPTDSINPRI